MQINKEKKQRRQVFRVLLLPYLTILAATLLISCVLLGSVAHRYMRETENLRAAQLEQLAVEIGYSFQYAIDEGDSLAFDSRVQLTAREEPLIYSFDDLRIRLTQIDIQRRFASATLYLNHHDLLVTRGVRRSSGEYYKWYEALQDVPYESFRQDILDTYHLRTFLPMTTLVKSSGRGILVIPYIQSVPLRQDGEKPNAQIVLYVQARPILDKLHSFLGDAFSHIYILYPDGEPGLQNEAAPDLSAWERKSDAEWTLNRQRYRVSRTDMEVNGITLLALSERSTFYADWNNAMHLIIWLIVAYVGIGVLASVLLARRNYRPIREINALVEKDEAGNEYERIRNAVMTGMSDRKRMTAIIEQQEPMVRAAYLSRLLNGPALLQDKEIRYLESLSLHKPGMSFYVVLFEFSENAEFFREKEVLPGENLRCALVVLENMGLEIFSQYFTSHFIQAGRYGGAFVLGCENRADALETVCGCCRTIIEFASHACALQMTAGISTERADIDELPLCQDEAQHALNHGLLMNRYSYTAYRLLKPQETETHFYFPADTKHQLSGALRAGEYDKAKDLIESLYNANFEKRNLNLHAGHCFMYEVGTTVENVLLGLMDREPSCLVDEEIGKLLRRLGENISVEEARSMTLAHVDTCQRLSAVRRLSVTEQLAERIMLFIDASAAEEWLDLGILADKFGVTPQYISHIFKKHKNQNIKDYISRRKLLYAKSLLRETNLTGEAISKKIGYASEAGLIRLFKKYENTTPSVYRQKAGPS